MASEFAKGCFAEGWMGAAGGNMPTPTYTNTADYHKMLQAQSNRIIQGALANQQNIGQLNSMNSAVQTLQWPPVSGGTLQQAPVTVVASMSPLAEIGRMKIRKLVDQLPLKVICRIHLIELHDMGNGSFKFVVTYTDFRTQDFCNVDEFPSPADVSLVLLGTP
jgi:hypothetical protein